MITLYPLNFHLQDVPFVKFMRGILNSAQHVSTVLTVDQIIPVTQWWDYNSITLAGTTSVYTTYKLKKETLCTPENSDYHPI